MTEDGDPSGNDRFFEIEFFDTVDVAILSKTYRPESFAESKAGPRIDGYDIHPIISKRLG
ncbi:MAG: hypothetical protein Ct9H90mP23_2890 [Methanobacteriota archaeon]|nr:MAG: hypothetical protein Ct9H90mP23_2890 [Euryarchaeota archaeon]